MASGKRFKLRHKFIYNWKGARLKVPVEFKTDFASIPRLAITIAGLVVVLAGHFLDKTWLLFLGVAVILLLALITKLGRYNKAAVVHDYLYQEGWHLGISRKDADRCFLDGMKDLGVSKWKRTVMYCMVRLFSWAAWKK